MKCEGIETSLQVDQLITSSYEPCASLEDQNMAMFQTIHKLCTLRRGLSADLIESAVVNLAICILDKQGKGLYTW